MAQPIEQAPAAEAAAPAPLRCFASFPEAIYAATGGRVQLPTSASIDTVNDALLNGVDSSTSPVAAFVIAIEYADANFSGQTLTVTSNATCDGFNFSVSNLANIFNDAISSARAFANCTNSIHFEHQDFGGAQINCGAECAFIGDAMNDHTSSIVWNNTTHCL